MARLLERGRESRQSIIASLLQYPGSSEDELMSRTELSRSTVRNTIGLLLEQKLARGARRVRDDGRRGPGPIQYTLTAQQSDAAAIENLLKQSAAGEEATATARASTGNGNGNGHRTGHASQAVVVDPARLESVFVIVKAGTNDAMVTKDGRMLRVEARALESAYALYKKILRGVELEALTLKQYRERFYPDGAAD